VRKEIVMVKGLLNKGCCAIIAAVIGIAFYLSFLSF